MEMVQNLIRNLSAAEKLQFYSYHTKPVLNFQALFTDGSSNYMNPVEPKTGDEVTVRFRTARENAEHVFLCVNGEKKEMQIASKTERFDFYESSFFMGTEIADYYFEIHSGGTCCYFNKKGPARDLEPFFNYKVTPGFSTPDWAKGAIFYQIYVDRFANGDTSNDVLNREYIYINQPSKKIDDWYRYPEECNSSISLASWNHLCFPVIFSDYQNIEEDEEDECDSSTIMQTEEQEYIFDQDNTDALPETEQCVPISNAHKYLKKLSCLPIFLLKESALGKARKGKEILSLKWNASNIPDVVPNEAQKHRLIMNGYIGLLEAINEAGYEAFRRCYSEASKNAYKEIGVFKKNAARDQRYCATLLISLLIADQYATKNTMFWIAVQDSLAYLRTCVIHHADTADFAQFVKCCITEKHEVLFYQDTDGIYLHYKQYWPAFQKYCKKHGIILSDSAAQFRRAKLNGYIKPQYTAGGSKYPRYDYRKKVDGREASVLNVRPNILKLAESK